jgi:hypothetical protein
LLALRPVGEQEENKNRQDEAAACAHTERKQVDLIEGRW